MKQIIVIKILFLILISSTAFAQPNLVLSTGSISTTSVSRGDHLKITIRISNIGNTAAVKSHTKIYISPTQNFTNAILLSEISCESLSAGQQTQDINFIYPLPYNVAFGSNYVLAKVDSRNEVVETDEGNEFYLTSPITITNSNTNIQNLPYPVLFIHGLNSDNRTWDNLKTDLQNYFGWSYGGNINFCLNQSSTSTDKIDNVQSWTSLSSLSKGDFYTLNFDVDRGGNPYPVLQFIYSNQASIVKQGIAVKEAISYVLNKTGRDKVILVGHSMGGLASREYLENLKQLDGKHHVAKLLTVGTPHGGSNSTSFGFLIANGLNEKSEAVRDLRTTYTGSGDSGVYLFGGREYYTRIRDGLFNFTNVDVNCNGVDNAGDSITGLNRKPIPQDLSYSCIIGTGNALGGDGIVDADKANLKNYYPNTLIDTFNIEQPLSSISIWHSVLQEQTEAIIKGLDEANEYYLSFGVDTGKIYFANFSIQKKTGYKYDYDDYKITLPQNGLLNCKLYNIPTSKCYFNILDSLQNIVYKDSTNGQGYYEFNNTLNKGRYFVEFYTIPEVKSWYYPYAFKLSVNPILPLTLVDFIVTLQENKAQLKWITTNEINTNKFDIERSTNSTDWNRLGSINSANLTGLNNYNFIDANPNYGINYYRLKMIDKDGSYSYSQIRTVEVSKPNTPFVIAPNPAKTYTTIYFYTPISKAEISIYDAEGRQVYINTYKNTSSNRVELNTNNFTSGLYIVNIKTSDGYYTERLIIANSN